MTGPLLGPGGLVAGGWPRPTLDALVLTGGRLDHYRRALSRPDRPWVRVATLTEHATAPGRLARRRGRLYAAVPEPGGLAGYRYGATGWVADRDAIQDAARRPTRDAAGPEDPGPDLRHARAVAIAALPGGAVALADEDGSVFSYRRTRAGWERDACLRLADPTPFLVPGPESVKLAQVTGDRDATPTPWGDRAPTLSDSLSSGGVRGTDLGVRVDHAGRTFLLFGDTHWAGRPWLATRDAIAEVLPAGVPGLAPGLPRVRFHGAPVELVGRAAGRVTMREYDVPLDGFSSGGRLYGLFSSNHFAGHRVMGRSVLARCEADDPVVDPASRRPLRFRVCGELSRRHFITCSVQLRPAAGVPGLEGDGEVLLIWGTGAYRASAPRLAVLDGSALARLHDGASPQRAGLRYWAGTGWSDAEADARPLLRPAALGELSVRWVEAAGRYLMLVASAPEEDTGPAVVLRSAPRPDGPWSPRLRLLDWVTTGMSADPHTRFIRGGDPDDPVGEQLFRAQARGSGAAYAPFLFDAAADGDDLVLRYTLSTWNPYQVVLMRHRLPRGCLG